MKNRLQLRVSSIQQETADSKTFTLQAVDNQAISYEAGQFLTFIFERNGKELRRSYSMSSAPEIDGLPTITVKRVPNGEISRFWLDQVKIGTELEALLPAGRFTLNTNTNQSRDIFLVGAGSGITPLYALLKKILHTEPQSQIHLIYSNKNEATTIFLNQLNKLKNKYPNRLTIKYLYSNPSAIGSFLPQHLNNTILENWVNQNLVFLPENAEFFLCGPENLMRMAKMVLRFMGFGLEQIHQENFTIPDFKPLVPYSEDKSNKQAIIHYQNTTYSLSVPHDKNILEIALANGIDLPYSCRGGRCATCQAKCTQGEVKMSINEVLTDGELAEGWILTCTAYPQSSIIELSI